MSVAHRNDTPRAGGGNTFYTLQIYDFRMKQGAVGKGLVRVGDVNALACEASGQSDIAGEAQLEMHYFW